MLARNHRVPSGSMSGRATPPVVGSGQPKADLVLEDMGRRIDLDVHGPPEGDSHGGSLRRFCRGRPRGVSVCVSHERRHTASAPPVAGATRARPNGPRHRSAPAPARDARTSTAPTGTGDSRRREVRVMAAKENGRAGQEWPPCPNTVTSSAAANPFGVRSLRRFHRAGSQWSSPGAALQFGERQQGGDSHARRDLQRTVFEVDGERGEREAGHDGALRHPGRLEGAGLGEAGVAEAHRFGFVGVLHEIDQMPAQRGEQVGHRRHVDEGDVEADPRGRLLRFRIGPGVDDPIEQRVLAWPSFSPRPRGPSLLQPEPELGRDLGQRGALLGLVGRRLRGPWRRGARRTPNRRAGRRLGSGSRSALPRLRPGPPQEASPTR